MTRGSAALGLFVLACAGPARGVGERNDRVALPCLARLPPSGTPGAPSTLAAPTAQGAGREASAVFVGAGATCARAQGEVWCWGSIPMLDGVVEDQEYVRAPIAVPPLRSATDVAIGSVSVCALFPDRTVSCWGMQDDRGFLGGATAPSETKGGDCCICDGEPELCELRPVPGLTDVVQLAASDYRTCARRADGTILCWGLDEVAERGDFPQHPRRTPTPIAGIERAVDMALALGHGCAILDDGSVRCWGPRYGDRSAPPDRAVPIPGLTGVTALALGRDTACARGGENGWWCWGELPEGGSASEPTPVPALASAEQIAFSWRTGCARMRDGTMVCWPWRCIRPLPGITDARSLSGSSSHVCLRTADGRVACWGDNGSGELGDGTTRVRDAPVRAAL